jgi:hypothetical protein
MKPVYNHSDGPGMGDSFAYTEVTSISHVQYANVLPYIVSYSMPFGMYSFMLQLKSIFSEPQPSKLSGKCVSDDINNNNNT